MEFETVYLNFHLDASTSVLICAEADQPGSSAASGERCRRLPGDKALELVIDFTRRRPRPAGFIVVILKTLNENNKATENSRKKSIYI